MEGTFTVMEKKIQVESGMCVSVYAYTVEGKINLYIIAHKARVLQVFCSNPTD